MANNKTIVIGSVTLRNRHHGLHIYTAQTHKLLADESQFSFNQGYFSQTGTTFSFPNPDKPIKPDLLLIQVDSSSLFFAAKGLALLWQHWRLAKFIINFKRPTLMVVHGLFDEPKLPNWLNHLSRIAFFKLLLNSIPVAFTSHSETEIKQLKNLFPDYSDRFHYLPHLIYPELLEAKTLSRPKKLPQTKKLLVTLGFIGPWKGQLELLKILSRLPQLRKKFVYLIAGQVVDENYYRQCREIINKEKLTAHVKIIKRFLSQKEFNFYLSQADIYLDYHTREKHTGSGTLAHALAAGKTILTTSNPYTNNQTIKKSLIVAQDSASYAAQLQKLFEQSDPKSDQSLRLSNYRELNRQIKKDYLRFFKQLVGIKK